MLPTDQPCLGGTAYQHATATTLWQTLLVIGCLLGFCTPAQANEPRQAGTGPIAHQVEHQGHPIRVWEKSPTKPAAVLLLVHGRTWSARPDFDLQAPDENLSLMDGLVSAGIATYAVDMRGYGETPRDASGWLSPNQAAQDLAVVLAWLRARHPQLAKPHLFGWSYGSMISQLCVQQNPQLAATLTLFGYPIRPGIDQPPVIAAPTPPANPNTAAAARSDFIVPGNISEAAIEAFVQQALTADPVRADWHQLEQWQALQPARIAIPTLLLEAELDPLARDAEHARFFTGLTINDKQWVMLPNGDHAAFMESPRDAFLSVLSEFILRPRPNSKTGANHD